LLLFTFDFICAYVLLFRQTHSSTGRLWAVLIQLEHLRTQHLPPNSEEGLAAYRVFEEALHEVPKSGEVWCEGARLALHRGDLAKARQFLDFSLHFTPQYGDSLIEYLRLALLEGESPADLNKLWQARPRPVPRAHSAQWLILLLFRFAQAQSRTMDQFGPSVNNRRWMPV